LGYIFNDANGYEVFKLMSEHYNHSLVTTSLNTSSHRKGKYWDNTLSVRDDEKHGKDLEDEIDRFIELVREPRTVLKYMAPFGLWAWLNGFSDDFIHGPLEACLTVLFVTKMGFMKQSTQVVLNMFSSKGFSHLRWDSQYRVQRGARGSVAGVC